ncbi:MAG: PorT family protein [Prolixibacteraceae bacterium]|nr:PorT family protein [Prolixibacteraceae bacterium]
MKRFFYILIFVLAGLTSSAQRLLLKNLTTFDERRLHFGFTLGLSTTDFGFTHYNVIGDNPRFDKNKLDVVDGKEITALERVRADISTLTPGFTVGIVTNLRLAESFDLRFLPGMSFGERKLVYNIPIVDINETGTLNSYSIKSTFLDFPLLLKYKSKKMNNQRPYLIAGGAFRIDISKSGQEDLVRLKPMSTYLEAGVGWDSYLQFFRLSTELKFSFGMDNVLDVGPKNSQLQVYSNAFSRLTSNMFTFSFHFE